MLTYMLLIMFRTSFPTAYSLLAVYVSTELPRRSLSVLEGRFVLLQPFVLLTAPYVILPVSSWTMGFLWPQYVSFNPLKYVSFVLCEIRWIRSSWSCDHFGFTPSLPSKSVFNLNAASVRVSPHLIFVWLRSWIHCCCVASLSLAVSAQH